MQGSVPFTMNQYKSQKQWQNPFQYRSKTADKGDQITPKPSYLGSNKEHFKEKAPLGKTNLNLQSPAFANSFAKGNQSYNKMKRQYTEFSQQSLLQGSQKYSTPFYTFEDNSTIKPNQNTIIRNPTLMNLGIQEERLNRSHIVKPVNLSKIEFNQDDDDADGNQSDYYSAFDTTPFPQKKQTMVQDKQIDKTTPYTKFGPEKLQMREVQNRCVTVTQIVNEIMDHESNPLVSDIALTSSQGEQYEPSPFKFLMTNQHSLPFNILKELTDAKLLKNSYIDFGFLDASQIAYFSINKKLFLWPFNFGIINEGVLQRQSNAPGSPFCIEFEQIVTTVALVNPLPNMQIFTSEDKQLIVATATEIKVYLFKKNPRENKFDIVDTGLMISTDNNIISKIVQFKKNGRVFYGGVTGHVNEIKFESTSTFDIKSYIQGEKKKLKKKDLESENLFQKFLPGFLKMIENKSIVDIKIDEQRNVLYSQCTSLDQDTHDQTIIEVFDLGMLSNKFQKLTTIRQYEVVERMFEFWQKEKVLRGRDIFEFAAEYKIIYISPITFSESRNWHLLLVTQNGYRIYIKFDMIKMDLSKENDYDLVSPQCICDFVVDLRFTKEWEIADILFLPDEESFVDEVNLNQNYGIYNVNTIQSKAQDLNLDMQSVYYDNYDSQFLFVKQNNPHDYLNPDEQQISIKLNIITKNDSTFIHLKQLQQQGNHASNIKIIEEYSHLQIIFDQAKQRYNPRGIVNPDDYDAGFIQEHILEIQQHRTFEKKEVQKLLGISRSHLEYKGAHASSIQSYFPLGIMEKQVYLLPNRTNILTDHRVIEIQQTRPIDHLAMLLHSMTRLDYDKGAEDIEDFMDLYTIKETCAMLIQIASDNNGLYLFSRAIEQKIMNKAKQRDSVGQQQRAGKNIGSKSSVMYSPYAGKSVSYAMHDQMKSHLGTYIFEGNEIGNQFVLKYPGQEIKNKAISLLENFGDTLLQVAYQHFSISEESLPGLPSTSIQFSSNKQYDFYYFIDKHLGLYLYLQRIIRPFWELDLFYNSDLSDPKSYIIPTFESLQAPRQKLADLYDYITNCSTLFYGEARNTTKRDKSMFVKRALYNQVILIAELEPSERQKLEIMEQNSLKNLKTFVKRCVQAIDLYDVMTFDYNIKYFKMLQKEEFTVEFKDLSHFKFQDLVNATNNKLLRRILDISLNLKILENEPTGIFKQRSARVYQICSSFFSEDESKIFVGETLLRQAIEEKTLSKKEELLKQAIENLSQEPLKIDMREIPRLLAENGNYTSLADLTLRKIKALNNLKQEKREQMMSDTEFIDQIEECHGVILALFGAIDQSITKERKIGDPEPKNIDFFDYFYQKLVQIKNTDQKIQLLHKILKRVEQFNDQVLLMTLYDYLMARPQDKFNAEILPQISEEQQNRIFDQMIYADEIQKEKFFALVKMLLKKKDGERLCQLAYKICTGKILITYASEQNENQNLIKLHSLSLIEKKNLVQQALFILGEQKTVVNQDAYNEHYQNLSIIDKQIQDQINSVNNIDEKLLGIRNSIKDMNDHPEKFKEYDMQALRQQESRLQEHKRQLESQILDHQELMLIIDQLGLNEQRIIMFMRSEDYGFRSKDKIKEEIQALVYFLSKHFQDHFKEKIKEKVQVLLSDKELLIYFLEQASVHVEQSYLNKNVKSELDIIKNGGKLGNTRFWLMEQCFENEQLKLEPSQIFKMFTSPKKNRPLFDQQTSENIIAKYLALLKLWVRKNQTLFKDQTLDSSKQGLILREPTKQELFLNDLKRHGLVIYQQQLQNELKVYFEKYSLMLPKDIEMSLHQIYDQVLVDFRAMLLQHNIQVPLQESRIGGSVISPERLSGFPIYSASKTRQNQISDDLTLPKSNQQQKDQREDQNHSFRNVQSVTEQNQQLFENISQDKPQLQFTMGRPSKTQTLQPAVPIGEQSTQNQGNNNINTSRVFQIRQRTDSMEESE